MGGDGVNTLTAAHTIRPAAILPSALRGQAGMAMDAGARRR
jgi:hypothetical protein